MEIWTSRLLEFTQAEIEMKLLKKVAKKFLNLALKLYTLGAVGFELENTKMPYYIF